MFAIKFRCMEAIGGLGGVVTKAGDWAWVVIEPEGWVIATSTSVPADGRVLHDVKVFKSKEDAEDFIRKWATKYHPWYYKPDGTYEIVPIKPRMVTKQQGWDIDDAA